LFTKKVGGESNSPPTLVSNKIVTYCFFGAAFFTGAVAFFATTAFFAGAVAFFATTAFFAGVALVATNFLAGAFFTSVALAAGFAGAFLVAI
jgi:hypothetical protein